MVGFGGPSLNWILVSISFWLDHRGELTYFSGNRDVKLIQNFQQVESLLSLPGL